MKKYKITYDSKGYLSTPVNTDEFYVAQSENEAVAVKATFPANVIGTVRAYIEYPGGGTITECGVLSVNNHSAIAVLSSDNLRYHYIKVGFEVVSGSKEMRYEPVTLEVDRFVNPSGSASPSPYTVTIKIGKVTELEPGEVPYVTNVGTEKNAIFDFGIPKGEDSNIENISISCTEFPYDASELDRITKYGMYYVEYGDHATYDGHCFMTVEGNYDEGWISQTLTVGQAVLRREYNYYLMDFEEGSWSEWEERSVTKKYVDNSINKAIGDIETSLEGMQDFILRLQGGILMQQNQILGGNDE